MRRKKWQYAVYKGDKYITEGTTQEICKKLGIKKETFYFYRTKCREKRLKGSNHIIIIRIDNV